MQFHPAHPELLRLLIRFTIFESRREVWLKCEKQTEEKKGIKR
jgi:hypothetical protein